MHTTVSLCVVLVFRRVEEGAKCQSASKYGISKKVCFCVSWPKTGLVLLRKTLATDVRYRIDGNGINIFYFATNDEQKKSYFIAVVPLLS